jgi:hypothetical protein
VAYAIDATVHPVEVSAVNPPLKRSGAHAGSEGLRPRDVSVLALREQRQGRVTLQSHL